MRGKRWAGDSYRKRGSLRLRWFLLATLLFGFSSLLRAADPSVEPASPLGGDSGTPAAGTLSGGPGSWDQSPAEMNGSGSGDALGDGSSHKPLEDILRNQPLLADASNSLKKSGAGADPLPDSSSTSSSSSSPSLVNPGTGKVVMPETLVTASSESILPGDYDVGSVYGTPLNVVDTPRRSRSSPSRRSSPPRSFPKTSCQ